jgi:hypothetical protein
MIAHGDGRSFRDAMIGTPAITAHLTIAEIDALLDYGCATGHCGAMVDRVLDGTAATV